MTATVIEKLPFARYIDLPGDSSTSLREMRKSPLQYKHWLEHGRKDTTTLLRGRGAHTAILEIQQFMREYVMWEGDRRAGKVWEEFKEQNAGKTILKPDDYDMAIACRDAVLAHAVAGPLLREKGRNELTIQWELGEHKLKSRIDRLCSALVDIKTARDVSQREFQNSAARYGYHTQLAFYQDAVEAAGLGRLPVVLVVVQSAAPHDVVVYEVGYDELEKGRVEYEEALCRLADCRKTNKWPGVAPNEPVKLRLPEWLSLTEDEPIEFGAEVIQ